jgi:serine protease Do
MDNQQKQFIVTVVIISIVFSSIFGFLAGGFAYNLAKSGKTIEQTGQVQVVPGEQTVIKVVKDVSPAVVSVIATKDLPVIEQYFREYNPFEDFFSNPFDFFSPFQFRVPEYRQKGTEKKEVGGGTGFIISSDGFIITNKHVVDIEGAEYTVLTNDGQKYPAKVLARDPVQDVAILKVEKTGLPIVKLGDSDKIEIGQSVIAIGNALGEFRNTVSTGVVSGLQRSITAASGAGGGVENLEDLIQTDAAINPGNSGGPLLNLQGEVIGINVAMASGAQSIGFALPINLAKKGIDQVKSKGKISYPFLGIRYTIITPALKEQNNLPVDYGALIVKGDNSSEPAIVSGSPADKGGLKENDIILEIDGQRIDINHTLAKMIQDKNVGDSVKLKVLRDGKEMEVVVALGER